MNSRSAFDLDCTAMIPGCGFKCPRCIEEIETTLMGMEGVSKAYIEKEGEAQKLIVEHNPGIVTVEQLIEVFKGLPTFLEGFFIPTLLGNTKKHN
jgi:hypothetical protein